MKKIYFYTFAFLLTMLSNPAIAGPGGIIYKTVKESFWIKMILVLLVIIFSPLIIYIVVSEKIKIRKTLKDLKQLAKIDNNFNWIFLKSRIKDSFLQVNRAWKKEDMKLASEWMTNWYWQNQQLVYLEQWEEEGVINICKVKNVKSIQPLYLDFKENNAHEESRIVVSISAETEDYLARRDNQNEIVEGKKGFEERETIWTFVLKNNKWLVENIEESQNSLDYVKLQNVIPNINSPESVKRST